MSHFWIGERRLNKGKHDFFYGSSAMVKSESNQSLQSESSQSHASESEVKKVTSTQGIRRSASTPFFSRTSSSKDGLQRISSCSELGALPEDKVLPSRPPSSWLRMRGQREPQATNSKEVSEE